MKGEVLDSDSETPWGSCYGISSVPDVGWWTLVMGLTMVHLAQIGMQSLPSYPSPSLITICQTPTVH